MLLATAFWVIAAILAVSGLVFVLLYRIGIGAVLIVAGLVLGLISGMRFD